MKKLSPLLTAALMTGFALAAMVNAMTVGVLKPDQMPRPHKLATRLAKAKLSAKPNAKQRLPRAPQIRPAKNPRPKRAA